MITFLSETQLMNQAGIDFQQEEWDRTVGVLEKLKKLGMIHIDNDKITVKNWEKRQETNLTSYERVKRFREKKRSDNAMITLEENRREENISEAEPSQVRIESFKEEDSEARVKSKPKYPNARTVFSWFPNSQLSWRDNITEQKCAELLFQRGEDKVKSALAYVKKHSDDEYCPKIVKPSDLERKWLDLDAYAGRK